MSEQTAAAAPVNACNHWVLAVSVSDVRSGRSLHGMQGVSGSNPLGSIPENPCHSWGFLFRGYPCYFEIRFA
jgi:hypothetical protein